MKKNIFVLVLSFLFLILCNNFANADVIMNGYKAVATCEKINNVDEFKDYKFFIFPTYVGFESFDEIKNDECFRYYKNVEPKLYAIKSKDLNKLSLEANKKESLDEIEEFLKNNPSVYKLNKTFTRGGETVKDDNPLKAREEIYQIFINDSKLDVKLVSNKNFYEDGSEKQLIDQGVELNEDSDTKKDNANENKVDEIKNNDLISISLYKVILIGICILGLTSFISILIYKKVRK